MPLFILGKSEHYQMITKSGKTYARIKTTSKKGCSNRKWFRWTWSRYTPPKCASKQCLYEARDLPGGRAYVYHDDTSTFDAGPTVITAPHTLTDLFELTGKKLKIISN